MQTSPSCPDEAVSQCQAPLRMDWEGGGDLVLIESGPHLQTLKAGWRWTRGAAPLAAPPTSPSPRGGQRSLQAQRPDSHGQ